MNSTQHHISKRKEVSLLMEDNSIAFFSANISYPTNADEKHSYVPNTDMICLTGIGKENSFFIITKKESKIEEYLFIEKYDVHKSLWDGYMISKGDARDISKIENVLYHNDLDSFIATHVPKFDTVYCNINEHLRNSNWQKTGNSILLKSLKKKFPIHKYLRINPIMHHVRSVKTDYELEIIRKSCAIASESFREVLKIIKPNINEFEIKASLLYNFMKRGAEKESFPFIIGSGNNSCTLHYTEANKICQKDAVILMDFGCKYKSYCSDMTRVVPINGSFNKRQKDIYNAVLRVHKKANQILKPNIKLKEYHRQVGEFMKKELIDLKLISLHEIQKEDPKNPAYKRYFMHGTSHFIGLDVHDYGVWDNPIQENMTFTVEPGIYVPEENIGVRIENCYIIKENKENINLMKKAPIEVDDIEEIMNSSL